jgi:DNA-directed RNA polymerase subunit RPC12/RpoP
MDECAICYESGKIIWTDCLQPHPYHIHCLEKHRKNCHEKKSELYCPLCRSQVRIVYKKKPEIYRRIKTFQQIQKESSKKDLQKIIKMVTIKS